MHSVPFSPRAQKKGVISMTDFMIRFLICNIYISGIIGILLTAKLLFKNNLSSRMQYNLWLLLLALLAVPFIPFHPIGMMQIFPWLFSQKNSSYSNMEKAMEELSSLNLSKTTDWINDFTLSINSKTITIGLVLFGIWMIGVFTMLTLIIRSALHLYYLKQSALPLQNLNIRKLYNRCLDEMNIKKEIPIFSTAFLKSPIIVGLLNPRIYLPIQLISDFSESDIRYMLLHELQHYRYKDALANHLMNFAGVLYWFNPFVWYALKEMHNDREIACDTSVLKMLETESYKDYGNTLINFAEKVSVSTFPFAAGLSGNMKQMKRRITNIASYENPTFCKKVKNTIVFLLIATLLLGFTPILSTYAAEEKHYQWNSSTENISYIDLSAYFGTYEGSFVLYDSQNDDWRIHDMEHATLRVAPESTYKIYDALFGLEENIITPDNSAITWNNKKYPFEAWNRDQTLQSAMNNSVNWYFQTIDEQLGMSVLNSYIQNIGYGNETIKGTLASYWMESSLKISPVEQVELLISMYNNSFAFNPANIQTVKDAIRLSSSENGTIYGKTGTGRVNGQDINGWFIGYIETADHIYFFATNIGANSNATGSRAAEITMSILNDMNIWK